VCASRPSYFEHNCLFVRIIYIHVRHNYLNLIQHHVLQKHPWMTCPFVVAASWGAFPSILWQPQPKHTRTHITTVTSFRWILVPRPTVRLSMRFLTSTAAIIPNHSQLFASDPGVVSHGCVSSHFPTINAATAFNSQPFVLQPCIAANLAPSDSFPDSHRHNRP